MKKIDSIIMNIFGKALINGAKIGIQWLRAHFQLERLCSARCGILWFLCLLRSQDRFASVDSFMIKNQENSLILGVI